MPNVYANGNEISCKAAAGKSICAFPDVCMSPPSPPAGPLPIPYPNTAFASDTTDGSKTVKIEGSEVMLKDQSCFKKSSGDEAATKAWGMGVVTHQIQGKVYFVAWSMDVKFEGQNVPRHLDMTTHNHASNPPDTPPIAYIDRMALLNASVACWNEREEIEAACDPPEEKAKCPDLNPVRRAISIRNAWAVGSPARDLANQVVHASHEQYAGEIRDDPCLNALACALVSYNRGSAGGCCPVQTPEHLIPASSFGPGRGAGHPTYSAGRAPCACAEGHATQSTHGLFGRARADWREENGVTGDTQTVAQAGQCGAAAHERIYPHCSAACIEEQLKLGHDQMQIDQNEVIGVVDNEGVLQDVASMEAELLLRP